MIKQLRIYAVLMMLCTLSAQVSMEAPYALFTPANTVFFFDLHDVVLKPDIGKRIKVALKNPIRTLRFAKHVATNTTFANGEQHELQLRKKGKTKQANLVRTLSAAYKVDTEVFKILQTLKAKGYKLCMASNIGSGHLNDLLDPCHARNKKSSTVTLNEVFALFDDLLFVDYESQEVIKKPDHRYYALIQERCGQHANIIFVDDNKTNIRAADTCGLHALRFTSAKKLATDLKTLGIL